MTTNDSALLRQVLESRQLQAIEVLELLIEFQDGPAVSLSDFFVAKGLLPAAIAVPQFQEGDETKALTGKGKTTSRPRETRRNAKHTQQHTGPDRSPQQHRPSSRYTWNSEIARGGLGAVWSAFDNNMERTVAAKELLPDALQSSKMIDRFYDEARITGQLDHPGVVSVYDLGNKPDGCPFYTMQLLDGRPWGEIIHEFHASTSIASDGEYGLHRLIDTLIDVCDAVGFAHEKNVIHRDLKPQNVMVGRFGETVVVDWGLAKTVHMQNTDIATLDLATPSDIADIPQSERRSRDRERTRMGDVIGTPSYVSPEQASGRLDLGPRSDVFALGVILYEILVGKTPFRGANTDATIDNVKRGEYESPRKINRRLSRTLDAICRKALQNSPDDRYANAQELGNDLRAWKAGQPIAAHQETLVERAHRWVRFHKSLSTAVALTVLSFSIASTVACVMVRSAELSEERARIAAEASRDEAIEAKEREQRAKEMALKMLSEGVKTADAMLIKESHVLQFYPGLDTNRKRLLEQAEASYMAFASNSSDDPLVKRATAESLIRAGDARQLLGRLDEAAAAYQRANKVMTSLPDNFAGDATAKLILANSLIGTGLAISQDKTQFQRATNAFESAEQILNRLIRQHPDNDEFIFARCRCKIAFARFNKNHDETEQARKQLEYSTRELELLVDRSEEGRHFDLLQSAEMELGRLHAKTANMDEATRCFRRVIARCDERENLNTLRPDQIETRMVCKILHGNTLQELAQGPRAADSYRDAIRDFDKLVSSLYRGQYHSENLAIAMVNLSQLQTDPKQATERIRTLAAAQNEFVQLIGLHGELPRLVDSLACTTLTLADAQRASGNLDAALQSYAQADAVFQRVLTDDNSDAAPIGQAILCKLHHAEVAWQLGRPQETEQLLEAAILIADSSRPGESDVAAAQAHVMLADIRWQAGNHDSARDLYGAAFELLENDPSTASRLALASLSLNCHETSLRSIDAAVEICDQSPDGPKSADCLHLRALASYRKGNWDASRDLLAQAISLRNHRHAADASLLALIEYRSGNMISAKSHFDESRSLFATNSWHAIRLQIEYQIGADRPVNQ